MSPRRWRICFCSRPCCLRFVFRGSSRVASKHHACHAWFGKGTPDTWWVASWDRLRRKASAVSQRCWISFPSRLRLRGTYDPSTSSAASVEIRYPKKTDKPLKLSRLWVHRSIRSIIFEPPHALGSKLWLQLVLLNRPIDPMLIGRFLRSPGFRRSAEGDRMDGFMVIRRQGN